MAIDAEILCDSRNFDIQTIISFLSFNISIPNFIWKMACCRPTQRMCKYNFLISYVVGFQRAFIDEL